MPLQGISISIAPASLGEQEMGFHLATDIWHVRVEAWLVGLQGVSESVGLCKSMRESWVEATQADFGLFVKKVEDYEDIRSVSLSHSPSGVRSSAGWAAAA